MSKKELPPQVTSIPVTAFKNRKRLIKVLVDYRLAFGSATLFDNHERKPRYSLDIIGAVLRAAIKKAIKFGYGLILSELETDLLKKIFHGLSVLMFASFLFSVTGARERRIDPNFIENSLVLEHDAIEKALGLPMHNIEKFIERESGVQPKSNSKDQDGNEL